MPDVGRWGRANRHPGKSDEGFAPAILPPKLARRGRRPILPRVLTLAEAALILRITPGRVRKLLRANVLGGFKEGTHGGGVWRTTDLHLLAYMGFKTAYFTKLPVPPNHSGRHLDGKRPQDQGRRIIPPRNPGARQTPVAPTRLILGPIPRPKANGNATIPEG